MVDGIGDVPPLDGWSRRLEIRGRSTLGAGNVALLRVLLTGIQVERVVDPLHGTFASSAELKEIKD